MPNKPESFIEFVKCFTSEPSDPVALREEILKIKARQKRRDEARAQAQAQTEPLGATQAQTEPLGATQAESALTELEMAELAAVESYMRGLAGEGPNAHVLLFLAQVTYTLWSDAQGK